MSGKPGDADWFFDGGELRGAKPVSPPGFPAFGFLAFTVMELRAIETPRFDCTKAFKSHSDVIPFLKNDQYADKLRSDLACKFLYTSCILIVRFCS